MIKNIFISGKPGCGKTTLIIEILKELNLDAGGFYTSEIREGGVRKGFKLITLDGKPRTRTSSVRGREGILAHQNIKSPYQVSKYKVNLKDLEEIGVKSILDALRENKLIVIDEVGKAEMFSEKFKKAVMTALDSKNKVLGTIKMTPDPFADKIRKRSDTQIFYLAGDHNPPTALPAEGGAPNRGKVKKEIKKLL